MNSNRPSGATSRAGRSGPSSRTRGVPVRNFGVVSRGHLFELPVLGRLTVGGDRIGPRSYGAYRSATSRSRVAGTARARGRRVGGHLPGVSRLVCNTGSACHRFVRCRHNGYPDALVRVRTTTAVNVGLRRRLRPAYRMSRRRRSSQTTDQTSLASSAIRGRLPNRRRASARASNSPRPCSRSSPIFSAMCSSISSCMARCRFAPCSQNRIRRRSIA